MDTCNKFPIDDAYDTYTIREKLMQDAELDMPDMSIYQGMEDMMLDDDYDNVYELCHLGAALGGGFENTAELRPMKYGQAMQTKHKANWVKAVREEYDRMEEHGVFKAISRKDVPEKAKIITATWAMKMKSDGTFRA